MIKAPKWTKDARATYRGWENSKGELLVARKHTTEQLNEFYGIKPKRKSTRKPKVKKVVVEPVIPINEPSLPLEIVDVSEPIVVGDENE